MTADEYRVRLQMLTADALGDGVHPAEVAACLVSSASSVTAAAIGARVETVEAMSEAAVEAMRAAARRGGA